MIVNASNLNAIYTNVNLRFKNAQKDAKPLWPNLATKVPSNTREESYAWLDQFPRLREWVGERQISSLTAHGYSIKNRKFESTILIKREDIEDDRLGIFAALFDEMGNSAAVHPDELLFELIRTGFTTQCFDGQYFFDHDHPVTIKDGVVSVSNFQAPVSELEAKPAWFLLDTSRPLKPFILQERRPYALKRMTDENDENVFMRDEFLYGVDGRLNVGFAFWQQAFASRRELDNENFNALYAAMTKQKTDEGRPLGIKPNILLVGDSNREAAFYIAQAERLANGASNPNYGLLDVIVTPYLD